MYGKFQQHVEEKLAAIETDGLTKRERLIVGPQQPRVAVTSGQVLNLCANNYLGLANHPAILDAAHSALDRWGFGMASVRFICGTQSLHRTLEQRDAGVLLGDGERGAGTGG